MVTFCEILPIKLLSLRELYLEGLGNESIISLTLSMIEAYNSSLNGDETSRPGLKKLTVDSARFDEVGFEAIGNLLNANPILQVSIFSCYIYYQAYHMQHRHCFYRSMNI